MLRHLVCSAVSSRATRRCAVLALVALAATPAASAQLVNFTARNGSNSAYCGYPTGGLGALHSFSTPAETHDVLSFHDLGDAQIGPSSAASALHATPAPQGISIVQSGAVQRGPIVNFAAAATADARDEWEFTITTPMRFSFSATLSATNSSGVMAPQSFLWGANGGGAQIVLDPGVPPSVFSGALVVPGTLVVTATGTFMPGQYLASLQGRAEGTNVWPYSGSFDNSLSLALACDVTTSYCTAGTTTNGCTAQIHGTGSPSLSASSGFTLDVSGMEGAAQGMIFYGVSGRAALPWGTSSSFVCVKSPTQRMGVLGGAGTAGACNGAMSIDWNGFISSHPFAVGAPFSAGELVQAQAWFRDAPSPKTTMLSDALEFAVCP